MLKKKIIYKFGYLVKEKGHKAVKFKKSKKEKVYDKGLVITTNNNTECFFMGNKKIKKKKNIPNIIFKFNKFTVNQINFKYSDLKVVKLDNILYLSVSDFNLLDLPDSVDELLKRNDIITKNENDEFKLVIIDNNLFMINLNNNILSEINLLNNSLSIGDCINNTCIYNKLYDKYFLLKNCNFSFFSNGKEKEIYINKEYNNMILTLGYCKH